MLGNLLKSLGQLISKSRDTVSDSTDFLDEVLEKEYIYNGVQNVKEATGKVVIESGKLYQQSKDAVSEATKDLSLENLKGTSEKMTIRVKKGKDAALKAGKDIKEKITDKEAIKEAWDGAIDLNNKLEDKSEDLLNEIKKNFKGGKK